MSVTPMPTFRVLLVLSFRLSSIEPPEHRGPILRCNSKPEDDRVVVQFSHKCTQDMPMCIMAIVPSIRASRRRLCVVIGKWSRNFIRYANAVAPWNRAMVSVLAQKGICGDAAATPPRLRRSGVLLSLLLSALSLRRQKKSSCDFFYPSPAMARVA